MRFASGGYQDGFADEFYHTYSLKIYEPYSIYYSIKTSIDILQGNIWFGSDIDIYDISSYPACEILEQEYMDMDPYGDGKTMYSGSITAISEGRYEIAVTEPSFSVGMILLEDEQGNRLTEVPLVDGQAVMEILEQYYHVRCGILVDDSGR